VTLEGVYAFGLSPAELQARVLERAAAAPEGSVARLYLEGVDPQAYRMLDLQAVHDAAGAALFLKLEPQFVTVASNAELPSVATIGGQWDGYLEGQDLTGLDRERVRVLGHEYLQGAIEAAG
jgi:hypothetical protein